MLIGRWNKSERRSLPQTMIEDYYTASPVIYSMTTDDWGTEPTWAAGSTIAAALNPASGREQYSAGRVTAYADYKLFCSDTVSLTDKQRIVSTEGTTFEVVFVKDTLNRGHHKKVLLIYAR